MQVPVYQRQAEQQGLPNARQTTQVDASNFLGGTEAAALKYGEQAAGDINKAVQHHYEQQVQEARQARILDVSTQLQTHVQDAMYGKTGALTKMGADAFLGSDGRSAMDRVFDDTVAKQNALADTLGDDTQKADFKQQTNSMLMSMRGQLMGHESQQHRVYVQSTLESSNAAQSRNIELGYNDHNGIQAARAQMEANNAQLSKLHGYDTQWAQETTRTGFSNALKAANASALQNNDMPSVMANIEKFGKDIDPQALTSLQHEAVSGYGANELQTNPQGLAAMTDAKSISKNAVIMQESGGKDYDKHGKPLTSSEGALYKYQVLPSTAHKPGFGITPVKNESPEEYNRVGEQYHDALFDKYQGNLTKLHAAYHDGPNAVDKAIKKGGDNWQEHISPVARDHYIPEVSARMHTGTPIDFASPQQKLQLNRSAESMLDRSRSVAAAELTNVTSNQYTQTYNTGQSGDLIPKESFVSAFGQAEGEAKHQNYLDNQAHAAEAFSLKDMPLAKLNETVAAAMPTADRGYGLRPDGTGKGAGYLGELKRPDGGIMTEYSVGVTINGKNMDIPSIVPILNKDEINQILNLKEGEFPSDAIVEKATKFAEDRIAKGLPVFHDTPTDTANFAREQKQYDDLVSIATHVQNERMKDPVVAAAGLGFPVKPVNWGSPAQAALEIAGRTNVSDQMSEKYGTPPAILSKDEAKGLDDTFGSMSVKDSLTFMSTLKKHSDPLAYNMTMQQLRKDSPVTALAGSLYGIDSNYFSGNNAYLTVNGQKAAETVLKGERLLNPDKGDKTEDGRNGNLFMPKDTDFKSAFDMATNGAFAGKPDTANTTLQAVRAAYAGLSSESGDTNKEFNTTTFDAALQMVTGTKGGALELYGNKIIPPYGMPEDIFKDRIEAQFNDQMNRNTKEGFFHNIDHYKIIPLDDGVYGFTDGNDIKPIVVNLNKKTAPLVQAANP